MIFRFSVNQLDFIIVHAGAFYNRLFAIYESCVNSMGRQELQTILPILFMGRLISPW